MLVEPDLVAKAQTGDVSAFNGIVQAYRKRILGTVYRLIGRSEDVDDVAQDVFVRLYYSLDQLRTIEVFEPWLYRLTINAAYDYLRRKKRGGDLRMADLSEEQILAADAAESGRRDAVEQSAAENRELVEALFREMSEDDRILLTLKEVEGLSLKELSNVYGVNENALKVRLFRARKRALRAFEKLKRRKAL